MNRPSITELLGALHESVDPDPAYAARLRERVTAELHSSRPGTARPTQDQSTEEVDMVLTTTAEGLPPGRRRFTLVTAAAAAVVLAGVAIGVGLASRSDDQPAAVTAANVVPTEEAPAAGAETAVVSGGFAEGRLESFAFDGSLNPYRVAVDDSVWIMSLDGVLTRRDPTTFEVQASVRVPESSLIAAGVGAVWIADAVSGDVLRLDPTTGETSAVISTEIAVSGRAWRTGGLGMLAGEQRRFARIGEIQVAEGSVWVADQDGRVLQIDPASNEIVDEVATSIGPDLLRVDGDHLLIADRESALIVAIDRTTGEEVLSVGPVGPAGEPLVGADLHAGSAYIQDPATGVVTRIDLETGVEVASEPLGASGYIGGTPLYPPDPIVSDAGVLVMTRDGLSVLDLDTLETVGHFDVNGTAGEMTMAPDGAAWIVQFYGSEVLRLTAKG